MRKQPIIKGIKWYIATPLIKLIYTIYDVWKCQEFKSQSHFIIMKKGFFCCIILLLRGLYDYVLKYPFKSSLKLQCVLKKLGQNSSVVLSDEYNILVTNYYC